MAKTGWLTTPEGFQKVEVVEEAETHRKVVFADGDSKGTELVLAGVSVPNMDCFPALFIQDKEPEGFRYKSHAGTRFLHKVELKDFSHPEQAKALIPDEEPYNFRPFTTQLIDGVLSGDHNLLIGPKGCGKTSMVLQLAARIGQPVVRLNFSGQISISDLVGSVGFGKRSDGSVGTIWNDGPLPTAMKNGYWLLCDEFDFGAPDILSVFYPVLEEMDPVHDKWPKLTLKEKDGEVIKAHPRFRIFATGNSIGGDKDGRYVGTSPMNAALLDRFAGHGQVIKLEKINTKEEKEILRMKIPNLPETQVKRATNFAAKMREGLVPDFSTRVLVNFCEKLLLYRNAITAAKLTFLSVIDDENTRKLSEDMVKNHFGVRIIIGRAAPVAPGGTATTVGDSAAAEEAEPRTTGRMASDVTNADEIKEIYDAYKSGKSYEAIEKDPKYGLQPSKGMTVWRIVNKYKKSAGIVDPPKAEPEAEAEGEEPKKKGRAPKGKPVTTSSIEEASDIESALEEDADAEADEEDADADADAEEAEVK